MGANAQTAVPTFTASQVLTAAQQNNSARTGVPVFASTTTRNAAFGGSNKTLAEGQLCYVEGVGLQSYNAAGAWVTWGAAPSSALVNLQGATFSNVTSVSTPNGTFTSTYANYKIIFQLTALTADADFTFRMRASGTDTTGSVYNTALAGSLGAGTASNQGGTTQTAFLIGQSDGSQGLRYAFVCDMIAPQLTENTRWFGTLGGVLKDASDVYFRAGGGHMGGANETTSYDAVTFISSVASSMTGYYKVYGYVNS